MKGASDAEAMLVGALSVATNTTLGLEPKTATPCETGNVLLKRKHEVAPPEASLVPGHGLQAVPGTSLYVPTGQIEQVPPSVDCEPMPHGRQSARLREPADRLAVCGGHRMHVEDELAPMLVE